MTIPESIQDKEFNRFVSTGPGATEYAVKVANADGLPIGGAVAGVGFTVTHDAVTVTFPSSTQEIYSARTGGIAGTVVQTITINYVNASKKEMLNAFRT
jgi:hypothetical protein